MKQDQTDTSTEAVYIKHNNAKEEYLKNPVKCCCQ